VAALCRVAHRARQEGLSCRMGHERVNRPSDNRYGMALVAPARMAGHTVPQELRGVSCFITDAAAHA
jgi:hypothetical protein